MGELQPLEKFGFELPPEHELKTVKTFIATKKKEREKEMAEKQDKEKVQRFNILKESFEVREIFPKVYKLYAAIDTFGGSTAVCEASF